MLHVTDAAAPDRDRRMAAVRQVLEEVGAIDVPLIEVYNKCDLLTPDERRRLQEQEPGALCISAAAAGRHGRAGRHPGVAPRARRPPGHADLRSRRSRRSRRDRPRCTATPGCSSTKRATARCRSSPTCRAGCSANLTPANEVNFSRMRQRRSSGSRCLVARRHGRVRAEVGAAAGRHVARDSPISSRRSFPRSSSARRPPRMHDRAWTFLQAGDLKNAEREFATALKTTPAFYPAEIGLGYVELARSGSEGGAGAFRSGARASAGGAVRAGRPR